MLVIKEIGNNYCVSLNTDFEDFVYLHFIADTTVQGTLKFYIASAGQARLSCVRH